MFRKTVIATLLGVVCCASVALASSPSDYIIPGRALMFDGTLSGLRAAYQVFDNGINDPSCSNNRDLRFLRAVTGTAMLVIGEDGGSIDSVLELARQFGIELLGDYWAPYFDPCEVVYIPLNQHGAYEIPPDAPNANEIRNILDASMIPDIEAAIADLNSISDTPGDRFRIFLDPNETRIFFDSNALGLQTDVEIDYGEVLILKGLLMGLKGQLEAQSAHDLYIDANDILAEKVYGSSFNINDDLLDPYPDFLKVLPTSNDPSTDGAALLAQARQDLIDSIDYYLDAIYYICNEDNPPGTDPQEDEFIYVDPNARFDLDIINGLFTDLRNSLEYDTVITYPAQTTKTYDIYDPNAVLIGELVLIYDFCDIEGEDGNLTFTGGNISPTVWEVDWHERDEDWIEVDLENHSGGQWWGGYLRGTLSYDGNNITDATLDYWGPDYGTLNGLSGELVSTVVVDANVNLNPIFSSSPTLSPRDLLPQFDEWNGPLPGTMGHGLGDDATLGGILPDMNQYDWQLLLDLQPGGLFYLDFVSPWHIIVDGDAGDWTLNQPVFVDISGDTDEPSDDVNGVDIAELYMAYDWENVYGAITFYDNIGAIFHYYNLYMSYSPDEDSALDTIRLYIEVSEDGSAYGHLYHINDEYGYPSWDYVDNFEVAVGLSAIEFKIPFTSIPAYLPGRFISIESGGWNSTSYKHDGEDNDTHLRIAGIGSISGTITYYYPTNALVCVQAYTDPCDPEGSLVASTTIIASGSDIRYTLEGIGIGWQGYIRAFTPLHGFNIFDLGAPIVQTSIPVFFMYAGLDGVDLVLSNPTIIVVDDDAPGDPEPGNPNISDPLEDGSTMHPFDSIQEAINAVADGNNVVVLEGTYTGTGNHDLDLLGKAVGLYGLSGPQGCIIDCQQQGRGFHFHSGETEDTLVDGFTIRNGLADKGGGIYFDNSSPTIRNCIITDNSPDAVYLQDSKPIIGGTVEVISDDITGNGTLQLSTGSILSIAGSQVDCNMTGLGTIEVPAGEELTIANDAVVDLGDPCDPKIIPMHIGIDCKGRLRVKDNAKLYRADIRVAMASFEGNALIGYNTIRTFESTPYGQMVVKDAAVIVNNDFHANGDRYIDVNPLTFTDADKIRDNHIYVTITKAVGSAENGIFELRGKDYFCGEPSCEPGNVEVEAVPAFDLSTWTIDRLELQADAQLTLANRFGFQADYDGDAEVLYVRELILGPNSILDIGANRLYYESLDADSTADIISTPLLGLSLDVIDFDDDDEFANRVGENNFEHAEDPSYDRVHVEKVSVEADPNGVMLIRNLEDIDPESPTYGDVVYCRAKTLFAKCSEDAIIVQFKYLFETDDPEVELHVYASDVPELLDHDDPNRDEHYIEAGYLSPPPSGRPGAVDSNQFGLFEGAVSVGSLDLTGGTWIELELIEPDQSVKSAFLLNSHVLSEPPDSSHASAMIGGLAVEETHCGICMDLNHSNVADEVDFAIALAACGVSSGVSTGGIGSTTCIERFFSSDGFIDLFDAASIDWLLEDPAKRMNACNDSGDLSLVESMATTSGLVGLDGPVSELPLASLPSTVGDLLISGKSGISEQLVPDPRDRLYTFDRFGENFQYYEPASERCNFRLLCSRRPGGELELYQINSSRGVSKLDDGSQEVVVAPGQTGYDEEPRYHKSAIVYVGVQSVDPSLVGRPVLDAAFDSNGYAYVVPVEVAPDGEEPYWAAAKLKLLPSGNPRYQVEMLYDNALSLIDEQYRNNPREIEVDGAGNVYVLNVHYLKSDILWKYDPNGTVLSNLPLYDSDSNSFVPDPIAMHISDRTETLYLATAQNNQADAGSTPVYGFSTKDLTLRRSIMVSNMQNVTGITEDPTTGTLWVVGFNAEMVSSLYPWEQEIMVEAVLAKISLGSNTAQSVKTSDFLGSDDLELPMSIVWAGPVDLGRVDMDGNDKVDLLDFALLAEWWGDSGCIHPTWCGGADLNPPLSGPGRVDVSDLLILARNWLKTSAP